MDITIYILKLFFFFYIALLPLFNTQIVIFNNCNFYYLYSLHNSVSDNFSSSWILKHKKFNNF